MLTQGQIDAAIEAWWSDPAHNGDVAFLRARLARELSGIANAAARVTVGVKDVATMVHIELEGAGTNVTDWEPTPKVGDARTILDVKLDNRPVSKHKEDVARDVAIEAAKPAPEDDGK